MKYLDSASAGTPFSGETIGSYRIGETLPTVYFDDDYKLDMAPRFATISQPSFELGRISAEQILRLIKDPAQDINHIILSGIYKRNDIRYK